MSKFTVISVDLAYKEYSDIGIAALTDQGHQIYVDLVKPSQLGLTGTPKAADIAVKLKRLCIEKKSHVLIIDGPQAWKDPENKLQHCRACEYPLNTPAKTGLPGHVKPANWIPFVSFSIDVFNQLQKLGVELLKNENDYPSRTEIFALESFPYAAWKTLKINPLPSKSKATSNDISDRLRILKCLGTFNISVLPTHDELQAIVMGIAGISFLKKNKKGYRLFGKPPIKIDKIVREGFIILPTQ